MRFIARMLIALLFVSVPIYAQNPQETITVTPESNPQADHFNHVVVGTASGNTTITFPIQNGITSHQLTFKVPTSVSALTVTFSARLDSTTSYTTIGSSTALGATISGTGTYHVGRVVITGFTGSGQVDFDYYGRTTTAGTGTVEITGDALTALESIDTAVNDTAAVDVLVQADTSGGCTWSSVISAATVNETEVKATAGQVYAIAAMSLDATPVYWKFYNDTAANIDETDTPVLRIMIPANATAANGAGVVQEFSVGVQFSTAITYRATTGIADNSTGALTASEVLFNVCYK